MLRTKIVIRNTLCTLQLPAPPPSASPLWQLVHHGWDEFLANYEGKYSQSLGPLHPAATATVESFLRCGDLASNAPTAATSAFLPSPASAVARGYGGQKGRLFWPSCHQRRVRSTSDWIATAVCHEVPHRQFVFTILERRKTPRRKIQDKNQQIIGQVSRHANESLVAASL